MRPWRVVAIGAALLGSSLALAIELLASLGATLATATDRWLWATSWLYEPAHPSSTAGSGWEWAYGYPPLGLWVALVTTVCCLAAVRVDRVHALRSAGAHIPHLYWSGCAEEARLAAELRRLGASQRMLFRVRQRRFLTGAGFAAAAVVLLSASAITGRTATRAPGGADLVVHGLSTGLGPWLCLGAGVIGVGAVLSSWPWRPGGEVLVRTGGTVERRPAPDRRALGRTDSSISRR